MAFNRKRIVMQAPGAVKASRPQRVGSSTCPKPAHSISGITLGNEDTDLDYNDNSRSLNGVEQFVLHTVLENGDAEENGCYYY
jgi:hypothetical protein